MIQIRETFHFALIQNIVKCQLQVLHKIQGVFYLKGSAEVWSWAINHIHWFLYEVITRPCFNFHAPIDFFSSDKKHGMMNW